MKKASLRLMSLPDDLLFNCLARVSRFHYPTLSLVSKSFRSLLASPELYKARSLSGHTESCLYLCINFYPNDPSWFILWRKPVEKNLSKSSGYVLAKLPILDSPPATVSGLVVVGSSIYNVCASGSGSNSSSVKVMDCVSHTWRHEVGASIPLELCSLSASALDRKIYVAGCYEEKKGSFKNTFQVLDTETLIWDPLPVPRIDAENIRYWKSACIDGKFLVKTGKELIAYDSKEGKWDTAESHMGRYMGSIHSYCVDRYMDLTASHCVIENVLYSAYSRELIWYDTKAKKWRKLKGLVELPKFPPTSLVTLADYGGKMAVLWHSCEIYKTMIWCAVISLDRKHKLKAVKFGGKLNGLIICLQSIRGLILLRFLLLLFEDLSN